MKLLVFTVCGLYVAITLIPTFFYAMFALGIIIDFILYPFTGRLSAPGHGQKVVEVSIFLITTNCFAFTIFWQLKKEL